MSANYSSFEGSWVPLKVHLTHYGYILLEEFLTSQPFIPVKIEPISEIETPSPGDFLSLNGYVKYCSTWIALREELNSLFKVQFKNFNIFSEFNYIFQ